jgi:death-on-curing protein
MTRDHEAHGVTDDLVYPSVDLVVALHEQIVAEGDATDPGVRSEGPIESAIQ